MTKQHETYLLVAVVVVLAYAMMTGKIGTGTPAAAITPNIGGRGGL